MQRRPKEEDEEIDSDDLPDFSPGGGTDEEEENDLASYFTETPEEKKIRLTKEYLEKQQGTTEELTAQLENEFEEESGTRFSDILLNSVSTDPPRYRAHKVGRPTCFVLGGISEQNHQIAYSANKTGEIVSIVFSRPGKKAQIGQTESAVYCIKYRHPFVATGEESGFVRIWDAVNGGQICELKGHRAAVYGLAFAQENQLISCSRDGTFRVWDYTTGVCMNTLYGHQGEIMAIDWLNTAVTCGSDRTVRSWDYEEEKQLVYHGGKITCSIDSVSLFNSKFCVTGSQDGKLCLWDFTKKKPIFVLGGAHGKGGWISSVAAYRFHRLFASGGSDGFIKFWHIDPQNKIVQVGQVAISGYVNDMEFSKDGTFLAAQISTEQRFGRWLPDIKEARQGIYEIRLEISEITNGLEGI